MGSRALTGKPRTAVFSRNKPVGLQTQEAMDRCVD
jgi:hypothetical protein